MSSGDLTAGAAAGTWNLVGVMTAGLVADATKPRGGLKGGVVAGATKPGGGCTVASGEGSSAGDFTAGVAVNTATLDSGGSFTAAFVAGVVSPFVAGVVQLKPQVQQILGVSLLQVVLQVLCQVQ